MRRVTVAVVLAALAVSCAGGNEVAGDRRVVGGMNVTFTVVPASVEVGNAVRFTLRLTNNTGRAEVLRFPTGQQYEFTASKDGDVVWRWSEGQFFTQAFTERTVGPQTTEAMSESWTPEEAGTYLVTGELKAEGYERSLDGELTVRG